MLRKLTTNELKAIGDGEREVYVRARLKGMCERGGCDGKKEPCMFYCYSMGQISFYTPLSDIEAYVEGEDD